MTYEEFMDLPFYKQVHETAKMFCKVNQLPLYTHGKPSCDYFKARQYFMSPRCMVPRQHIKNVWKWLDEKKEKCSLYKTTEKANQYISECQSEKERQKVADLNAKQYDVSDFLEDFLS